MVIQSILIPNNIGMVEAKKWLKENGYKLSYHGKHVHKTNNYLRFRQSAPLSNTKVNYRTITLNKEKGIKAIAEYPKRKKCHCSDEVKKCGC